MIQAEICANSIESAIEGQKGGAFRIELCDNLEVGGLTPTYESIHNYAQTSDIQVNILIRPREGNFIYTNAEFEQMKRDIHFCGHSGCNGVVFGILNNNGFIDKKRNKELLEITTKYGMNATFHRAIDICSDIYSALEDSIELGFTHILTSGGKEMAIEGKYILKRMIEIAESRITIIPGGGITEDNIAELVAATGLKEFHGSFRNIDKNKTDHKKVEKAIKRANAK